MVCDFGRIRTGIVTMFWTDVIFGELHPKIRNWNTNTRTHNKKTRQYFNFNDSNIDGWLTVEKFELVLSVLEIFPTAQENKYLGIF